MPEDALNSNMRLITAVDAAEVSLIIGCWGSFQKRDGTWSSQHIIGRGLLVPPNGTIPKIAKLRQSCDSFCVHKLQETTLFALLQQITFVCRTAIENILSTTPIVYFVCLIAIANIFMEQQLLYGLL